MNVDFEALARLGRGTPLARAGLFGPERRLGWSCPARALQERCQQESAGLTERGIQHPVDRSRFVPGVGLTRRRSTR